MDGNNSATPSKKEIRKAALSLRNEMPDAVRRQKSRKIQQTLRELSCYRDAHALLSYVDYQSEVITTPLLEGALKEGKKVFVPRVSGDEMEFYRITDCRDLRPGYRGIREPVGDTSFQSPDGRQKGLMLMPGVAFDQSGHRIGYGKGYYDRYLERMLLEESQVCIIALCFEIQIFPQVPWDCHDRIPDMILTEERIIETGRLRKEHGN